MNEVILSTERVKLRFIELADLEAIHHLHSLPEVDEYNTLGIPENIDVSRSVIKPWIEDNQKAEKVNFTFAITDNDTSQFIGLIALKLGSKKFKNAEVWYKLNPTFWGMGYGTEALKGVLEFGFDKLGLHRIEAGCAVDNIGSIKVLEKAGMKREGRKRKVLPLKSGWSDNYEYAMLGDEWKLVHRSARLLA